MSAALGSPRILVLAAALLLSGCWIGAPFYAPADLRAPVVAGDYRLIDPRDPGNDEHARVSILPNGMTRFDDPDASDRPPSIIGFAELDRERGVFVAWLTDADGLPGPNDTVAYGLLLSEPNGEFRLLTPTCQGEMEIVATGAGATVVPDEKVRMCRFSDRASLEAALRQLVPRVQREGARLAPLDARPRG